jgi:hypothetical protein
MKDTNKWIPVHEQEPEPKRQVVALSPEGYAHLTQWRPAYSIFCCQGKRENTSGWKYVYIPKIPTITS